MKYVTMMQGGLGDVLLAYLGKGRRAGYVQALRERQPEAHVRCAILGTNPAAAQVVAGFDAVTFTPWDSRPVPFEAALMREYEPVPLLGQWQRPPLLELALAPDSIAFHPFAGGPLRDWRGHVCITWMICALAETGRDVYVLGGSGPRWEGRHEVREVYLHESVTVPKLRNVHNLIGASAAEHASIVARCGHFVGSFSAYYCAAHACGRPTFVLTDKELARFVRLPAHPVFGGCLEDRAGARWDYFGRQSDADQIRAIVEWTRG